MATITTTVAQVLLITLYVLVAEVSSRLPGVETLTWMVEVGMAAVLAAALNYHDFVATAPRRVAIGRQTAGRRYPATAHHAAVADSTSVPADATRAAACPHLEAERADYHAVLAAVGALGGRVDGLGERVDGLIERVEGVEVKTDANREAINALGEKLAGFKVETRDRFDAVEHKIDAHHEEATGRFRSVDEQLADIKDLIIDPLGGSAQ
jgi:hypothetical protein